MTKRVTTRRPQAIRAGIHARQAIVDGELVVLDAGGKPSFERMQQRMNVTRDVDVRRVAVEHPVTFIAFDLLELDGRDLLSTELRIRKKTLRETIVDSPNILFAEHVERDGKSLFDVARESGIEGIVGKRADSLYRPGIRSPEWVKIKSWLGQSCVIAGYTAGRGRRTNQLGALILAVLDGSRLVHCGQVGTGFDEKTLRDLRKRLKPLEVPRPASSTSPPKPPNPPRGSSPSSSAKSDSQAGPETASSATPHTEPSAWTKPSPTAPAKPNRLRSSLMQHPAKR